MHTHWMYVNAAQMNSKKTNEAFDDLPFKSTHVILFIKWKSASIYSHDKFCTHSDNAKSERRFAIMFILCSLLSSPLCVCVIFNGWIFLYLKMEFTIKPVHTDPNSLKLLSVGFKQNQRGMFSIQVSSTISTVIHSYALLSHGFHTFEGKKSVNGFSKIRYTTFLWNTLNFCGIYHNIKEWLKPIEQRFHETCSSIFQCVWFKAFIIDRSEQSHDLQIMWKHFRKSANSYLKFVDINLKK